MSATHIHAKHQQQYQYITINIYFQALDSYNHDEANLKAFYGSTKYLKYL